MGGGLPIKEPDGLAQRHSEPPLPLALLHSRMTNDDEESTERRNVGQLGCGNDGLGDDAEWRVCASGCPPGRSVRQSAIGSTERPSGRPSHRSWRPQTVGICPYTRGALVICLGAPRFTYAFPFGSHGKDRERATQSSLRVSGRCYFKSQLHSLTGFTSL